MLDRFLYRSYAGFYRIRRWRTRHITQAGMMVLALCFFSAFFGINILKTNLYQVAALAGCLGLGSFFFSLFAFKCDLSVIRHLPDHVTAGDKLTYEIEIVNHSEVTQKGLVLYEDILDPRPSFKTFLEKKEPFENQRNAWDRKTMYYRWAWLIYKNQNAFFPPVFLPDLPSGEPVRVSVTLAPNFRGYVHFTGVTFARPDMFGLFNRLVCIREPGKLLVLPRPLPVELPDQAVTRHYHPGGIQLATSIGNSDEFMGLRQYRPGDSLRNIHWKSFAKTGELVIREFEDEFFQRYALLLDTNAGPEDDAVFEESVSMAAYCITVMQQRDAVMDLMFAGNRFYTFSSGRGLGQTGKILEVLGTVEPCPDKTIADLIPVLEKNISQFSGMICLFLSWSPAHRKILEMFEISGVPCHTIIPAGDKPAMEQSVSNDRPGLAGIHVIKSPRAMEEVS